MAILIVAFFAVAIVTRLGEKQIATVLVLNADTLMPASGVVVNFCEDDWRLRLLGGANWPVGRLLVQEAMSDAHGKATFALYGRRKHRFRLSVEVPSGYVEVPMKPGFHQPPDVDAVFFLARKR